MSLESQILKTTIDLVRADGRNVIDEHSTDYADSLMSAIFETVRPYIGGADDFAKAVVSEALETIETLIEHFENYEPSDDYEEDDSECSLVMLRALKNLIANSDTTNTPEMNEEKLNLLLRMTRQTSSLREIMGSHGTDPIHDSVTAVHRAKALIESNHLQDDFLSLRMRREAMEASNALYEHFDDVARILCMNDD